MKRPAVFLDRDNTLIHNDGDLGDPEAVKLIQGVASAISSLCGLGYKVVVVTNQGGVARGKYTEEDVDAVHDRIEEMVRERANGARIDAFYFCPFHPQGTVARYKKEHPTRKPKPGMLLQAAEDLGLDPSQSWMVGDALRDIEAGSAAGCRTVLLQADWTDTSLADLRKQEAAKAGKKSGRGRKKVEPDFVAKGLVEAVRIIASQRKPEASEEISRTRIAGKRWDAEAMAKLQQPRAAKPEAEASPSAASKPDPESTPPETSVNEKQPGSPEAPSSGGGQASAKVVTAAPPARPFVPWSQQAPAAPEETSESAPDTASEASPLPESTSARPDPAVTPETPAETSATPTPAPLDPSAETSSIEVTPSATPNDEAKPTAPPDPDALAKLNKTMRLVLQEMRMQRGTSGEFQQLGVVAIALQAVTFTCLLGALWMGGGTGGDGAFLRWIGVAIILQLAVIATLLFSKPSG